VVFDQHPADRLVRGRGAEQHTIRHDDGRAAAGPQQLEEQRHEQELGLLGLDQRQQVFRRRLIIERAGEGRVG
jgi:hypothetical protein